MPGPDRLDRSEHGRETEAPVGLTRSGHGYQAELCVGQRLDGVGRRNELTAWIAEQLGDSWLSRFDIATVDRGHSHYVDVQSAHLVTSGVGDQGPGQPKSSQSDNAEPHRRILVVARSYNRRAPEMDTGHKTALVAGAGGFIGGHLVADLLRDGRTVVRAVDIRPLREWQQRFPNAESLQLDLCGPEACHQAVDGADEIYNLAADMGGIGYIAQNQARPCSRC